MIDEREHFADALDAMALIEDTLAGIDARRIALADARVDLTGLEQRLRDVKQLLAAQQSRPSTTRRLRPAQKRART